MAPSSSKQRPVDGAVRGVVAAMAMTGLRRMTKGLGLMRESPPERVARKGVPQLFARIPASRRDEAIELAHWAYGAVAGGVYGALAAGVRRRPWAGPAYGVAIWVAFEAAVAPVLFGPAEPRERPAGERLALVLDHLLFGAVVGTGSRRD